MDNNKWRPPSFLWLFLFVCGALVVMFNVVEIQTYAIKTTYLDQPRPKPTVFTEDMHMKGFLVRTPGCTIPEMNVMDASIKDFIFQEDQVLCNDGVPALVGSNDTSIFLIESSLIYYNINDTELLNCCYQPFYRKEPKKGENDKLIVYHKKCFSFNGSVDILEEFVKVKCSYNHTEIYKDFFNFVPLKNVSSKEEMSDKNRLNVLMIGIDAVSRLNLHRQMPKTIAYLNKLQAVEMMGYNKVGDNTFPNIIPVLTGLTEDELKTTCWPKQGSFFDKCPFIWNKFKAAGYTTAFGEDAAWMGIFNYNRKGFKIQPTDYFWDHFDLTAEKEIGNKHRLNVEQCIGARSVYKVFLDYMAKFTKAMHINKQSFFAFFWGATLSHDFLNKPKLGDTDYYNFLKHLDESGILKNTALILMSDHGIRWGDIRTTYQGRMEERLPFLYIRLPHASTFDKSALTANLRTNRRRLTTPFDLHETLNDLVNFNNLSNDYIVSRNLKQGFQRGYSLFGNIKSNRTCKDAQISPHWCTCQTSQKIARDDPLVLEAANFTVDYINNMLDGYADCMPLELDAILDSQLQINGNSLLEAHYSKDYTITIKTKPGGGIFETTIRKHMDHFNVTGTISRINLYGKQSLCITDFHLKLYCYCKQYGFQPYNTWT